MTAVQAMNLIMASHQGDRSGDENDSSDTDNSMDASFDNADDELHEEPAPEDSYSSMEEENDDDSEDDSDADDGRGVGAELDIYKSKKGNEIWQKQCRVPCKFAPQNVMKKAPGPTAYAVRNANSISETLRLFITRRISSTIMNMSNKEGQRVFGESWIHINDAELDAYFGLLYLAGVFRSSGEATEELWNVSDGRTIFRAVMSRHRFNDISRVMRFDEKDTRLVRRRKDRLAPIRDVLDIWVGELSKCFIPYENVTIDEQLVPFRGRCSFRQFMKSKPAKYGIKIWTMCDSSTSYALNAQVYTGRVQGQPPERNQGERVVRDMVEVIDGR